MYPPVGVGQTRVCANRDTMVGGRLLLPAGTIVTVPHHTLHNVSFNWDAPDKFLPGEPPSASRLWWYSLCMCSITDCDGVTSILL